MKRALALVLTLAVLAAYQLPTLIAAGQNTGEIAGTAVVEGKPLPNITVRLRNVDNGQLQSTMRTNANGEFRFTGLPVGNFVVETVADNGTLLGTSARIGLVAGAMLAGSVTVTTSAAAAAAAGVGAGAAAGAAGAAGAGAAGAGAAGAGAAAGAAGAGAAAGAAAAGGAFFATTAGIVTAVAVGAGVTAAVVATTNDASASGG